MRTFFALFWLTEALPLLRRIIMSSCRSPGMPLLGRATGDLWSIFSTDMTYVTLFHMKGSLFIDLFHVHSSIKEDPNVWIYWNSNVDLVILYLITSLFLFYFIFHNVFSCCRYQSTAKAYRTRRGYGTTVVQYLSISHNIGSFYEIDTDHQSSAIRCFPPEFNSV